MDSLSMDGLKMEALRLAVLIILVDSNYLLVHNFSFYFDRCVVDLNWGRIGNAGNSVALRRKIGVDLLRICVNGLRVIKLFMRTRGFYLMRQPVYQSQRIIGLNILIKILQIHDLFFIRPQQLLNLDTLDPLTRIRLAQSSHNNLQQVAISNCQAILLQHHMAVPII